MSWISNALASLAALGLLIAGCEGAAWLGLAAWPEARPSEAALPDVAAAPAHTASLAAELAAARRPVYRPFVVWRQAPFEGRHVRIDARGNRFTPERARDDDTLSVWVLGGSSVWGEGVADGSTLPSQLARALAQVGEPARVRNLGEIDFVSSQLLVLLIRELQRGERPDVVLLLAGRHDAEVAAFWPEVAGAHTGFYAIRDRFERSDPSPRLLREVVRRSHLARVAARVRAAARPDAGRGSTDVPASQEELRARVARAGARWLDNCALLVTLARRYGFASRCLIEPGIAEAEAHLTPPERRALETARAGRATQVAVEAHAQLERWLAARAGTSPALPVRDVRAALADAAGPVFAEAGRFTTEGYGALARALAREVRVASCTARGGDGGGCRDG